MGKIVLRKSEGKRASLLCPAVILGKASESECCSGFGAKEPLQKQRSAFPISAGDGSVLNHLSLSLLL